MPPPTSTTFFLAFLAVSLPRREASAFQSRAASKLGAAAFAYDVGIERERAARNINRDIGVIITHSLARIGEVEDFCRRLRVCKGLDF